MRIKSITISGLRSFGPEPVSETPEDVVVVERPFGHTKLKRLERAPLAHWLQEYSLGQIHNQAKESVLHKLNQMADAVKGTDIKIIRWDDIKTVSTEAK